MDCRHMVCPDQKNQKNLPNLFFLMVLQYQGRQEGAFVVGALACTSFFFVLGRTLNCLRGSAMRSRIQLWVVLKTARLVLGKT